MYISELFLRKNVVKHAPYLKHSICGHEAALFPIETVTTLLWKKVLFAAASKIEKFDFFSSNTKEGSIYKDTKVRRIVRPFL